MDLSITAILKDFAIAFIVGSCWAILFNVPKRILWLAGLLGGMGHALRFVLLQLDVGLVSSTLAGSVFIGLLGIYAAYKVDSPPVVFTMPACITMIPGIYAYKTMLAGIKLTDEATIQSNPNLLLDISHNMLLTMSLLFTLAIGITIGAILFRNISIRQFIKKEIERKV